MSFGVVLLWLRLIKSIMTGWLATGLVVEVDKVNHD